MICEAPEQCSCACHKLGYISHASCCDINNIERVSQPND